MFERFTDRSRRVLVLAQEETRRLNTSFIGTEHLLLALIDEREGVAATVLDAVGITHDAVFAKVSEIVDPGEVNSDTPPSGSPPFTPRSKKVLELALREALQLGHSYIGTEHILLGLVREGEGVGAQAIVALGHDLGSIRAAVIKALGAAAAVAPRQRNQGREVPPVDQTMVYQLRQEIARLRDVNQRLRMAISVLADQDMPLAMALRKALEELM